MIVNLKQKLSASPERRPLALRCDRRARPLPARAPVLKYYNDISVFAISVSKVFTPNFSENVTENQFRDFQISVKSRSLFGNSRFLLCCLHRSTVTVEDSGSVRQWIGLPDTMYTNWCFQLSSNITIDIPDHIY